MELRLVQRLQRAETAAAVTGTMLEAVAVAVAAAAAAPVYPVARYDIRRQIRQQNRHRRPRAIREVAAAIETAVAATGDNTQEGSG